MSSVPAGANNAAGLSLPSVAAAAAAAVASAAAAANASAANQGSLPSSALSAAAAAAVAAATNAAASNANDAKSKQLAQNMGFNVPQLPTVGNSGSSLASTQPLSAAFSNLTPSPFMSSPLYPANYAASVQSMIGSLQPRPGNSLAAPLLYADSNPLNNYNAMIMKNKYKKKINLACHFCDHAARRPGRQKTAMLVSCSSPHCRKVFCSRPACYKKLPIGLRINTWEGFVEWKRQLELGLAVFVCPHCVDESHCPGPQCQKRWQKRLNRGTGAKSISMSAASNLAGSSNDNDNKDSTALTNAGLGLPDSLNVLPQLSAMLQSGIQSSSILGGFGASMPSGLAAAAAAAVAAGAASGNANAAAAHAAMNAVMNDASLAAAASAASKVAAAQPGSATANALNAVAAASAAAAAAKNAAGAPSGMFPGTVDFSAAANAVLSASLNSANPAARGQKSATSAPGAVPPTYSQLMSIQQQVGLSQLSSLTGNRNVSNVGHSDDGKK